MAQKCAKHASNPTNQGRRVSTDPIWERTRNNSIVQPNALALSLYTTLIHIHIHHNYRHVGNLSINALAS